MHHKSERQSEKIAISDLIDLSDTATDVYLPKSESYPYSPPWIKDLIIKKKEKLVDIVNAVAKQEHNSYSTQLSTQLNFSSPSSKGCKTSIGSNTSITTQTLTLSPIGSTGAYSETNCCLSCLSSQGDDSCHSSCKSGFNSKAVHLSNRSTQVNVPIVRSVSSSLVSGRQYIRCLVCDSIQCVNNFRTQSNISLSEDLTNNSNQINSDSNPKCSPSQSIDLNIEQISPGLVATRRQQILKRQVSESSYLLKTSDICEHKTYATNIDNIEKSLVTEKMIDDKNKDDSSEYFNNDRNHHHYEVIIDYKRSNSLNSSEKESNISNDMNSDEKEDNEYEFKYGPGIVDKLKLKFMSISIQQTNSLRANKLKRFASLENIAVTNDSHLYQTQQSLQTQQQYLSDNKESKSNELLLPLLTKNGTVVNLGSITGGGNRTNGNHLSHRLYIQHHNSRNIYNNRKSTASVPVIKRAKSMETLLFEDEKDKGRQPLNYLFHHSLSMVEKPLNIDNDIQLVNENVLIIENTTNELNESQKLNQQMMKSASNENNDELPKPDTVKIYKRIFEPNFNTTNGDEILETENINNNKSKSTYKKILPPTNANVKRKPPVVRATNKNSSLKSVSSLNSLTQTIKTQPQPVPPLVFTPVSNTLVEENNDKNNNKSANTSVMSKPPIAPKRASLTGIKPIPPSGMSAAIINKNIKMNGSIGNSNRVIQNLSNNNNNNNNNNNITTGPKKPEKSAKLISSEALDRIRASGTSVTFNGSDQSSSLCPISQIIPTTYDSSEKTPNNVKVNKPMNKPIANIKPFTQNNDNIKSKIVNNCQTVINDYSNGRDLGHDCNSEIPIGEKGNLQFVETNNINSNKDKESDEIVLQSVITTTIAIDTTDSRVESNNDNIIGVNDENVSPNTCDINNSSNNIMVERNKVQRIEDHTHTQTDVLKPSLLLNGGQSNHTSNKPLTSSLWSQQTKKPTNSSTTTIVFDFRGKDVKSNLAIHPTPFGSTVSKRSTKKTPKDGSINTNGSNDDSGDEDDSYTGSLEIPLPSGIIFMGENVKVGKGSMLLIRNKKLNIQFNDSAISTFEYPSEASLLAETQISSDKLCETENKDEIKSETKNTVISSQSQSSNSLTTLKTNLVLGGSSGGLGSYKPTLLDTPFELGVSRTHKTNPKTEIITNELNIESNPDETTSWSTSSTASDLLF